MTQQSEQWRRVAAAVTARMAVLRIDSQADLIALSGVSQPTARQYMTGEGRGATPRSQQVGKIGRALQWPADWWRRIEADEDLTHWSIQPVHARVAGQDSDDTASITIDITRIEQLEQRVDALETKLATLEAGTPQPAQFAVAAEGAEGRPPTNPGRRVSRPHPPAEE